MIWSHHGRPEAPQRSAAFLSAIALLASHNFGADPAFYDNFTKAFDVIANQQGIPRIFAKARAQDVGVMCMKTTMGAKSDDLRQYKWGDATACTTCVAQSCLDACPYGLDIPQLMRETAHLLEPARVRLI